LRIWECGMQIGDFELSFWFVSYSFQSEIRNSKFEITLTPLLQMLGHSLPTLKTSLLSDQKEVNIFTSFPIM